jgi:hypothetical protein
LKLLADGSPEVVDSLGKVAPFALSHSEIWS